MASTTFIDNSTIIYASWLNAVNTAVYTTLPLKADLVSPAFTTPSLGVATATSINKVAITTPATNATLTIPDGLTATVSGTNTGDQSTFSTIAVSGQSNVVADTNTDTLTLVAGTGMTITTNAATDTITLNTTAPAATVAEVKVGTSNVLALTPLNTIGALGFSSYFQSADQTITPAGTLTIAHGLGRAPVIVLVFLKCTTAIAGYAIGDIIPVPMGLQFLDSTTPAYYGITVVADATNISVKFGQDGMAVLNKTTGINAFILSSANFKVLFRVFA